MEIDRNTKLVNQVRNLLSEAIHIALDDISPDLALGDVPQWDSMGHMEVMMRLEESFGIEINADTIAGLISISEICSYLEKENLSDRGTDHR